MRNGSSLGGQNRRRGCAAPRLSRAMPLAHQFLHDGLQARMVKALAQGVVEFHPQPAIDGVELDLRKRESSRARCARFSASPAWSFTSSLRGRLQRGRESAFADLGADRLVEAFHLGDADRPRARPRSSRRLPADQQHAELRAPVAEVVVRDDPVAQQAERAGQRIAQDGGADVADVHRLGHVGRTEIDDHGPRLRGGLRRRGVPRARRPAGFAASTAGLRRKLRKPAPAISTCSQASATSSLATTSAANWRGFSFRALASDIRALVW